MRRRCTLIASAAAAAVTMAGLCAPVTQAAPGCRDQGCVENCVNAAYARNDAPAAQRCMTDWKPREHCDYSAWNHWSTCKPCDQIPGTNDPCDGNVHTDFQHGMQVKPGSEPEDQAFPNN